jgi:hypothetical protein
MDRNSRRRAGSARAIENHQRQCPHAGRGCRHGDLRAGWLSQHHLRVPGEPQPPDVDACHNRLGLRRRRPHPATGSAGACCGNACAGRSETVRVAASPRKACGRSGCGLSKPESYSLTNTFAKPNAVAKPNTFSKPESDAISIAQSDPVSVAQSDAVAIT